MAFDARGWRKLVIGGQLFYWAGDEGVRGGEQTPVVRVRPARAPYCLLRVVEAWCGVAYGFVRAVTPGVAKAAVDSALALGWVDRLPMLTLRVFGNPFWYLSEPPTVGEQLRFVGPDPRSRTETVLALATAIDEQRAFDRMPILADALEDAGCDSRDMLAHCRGDGPHVRGCWVVNLLIGKS